MDYDVELDKYLRIKTNGRDDSNSNYINFPYEATPYKVLEVLSNSGYIKKNDKIIDFGCGKGRVDFYLSYYNKAKMIGVEYDKRLYNDAIDNIKTAISSNRVSFINENASLYEIEDDVVGAYFFNPFSTLVLKDVLENIKNSLMRNKRNIYLYFYYPSVKYVEYLSSLIYIKHIDDIDCNFIYNNNDKREYIAIYKILSFTFGACGKSIK